MVRPTLGGWVVVLPIVVVVAPVELSFFVGGSYNKNPGTWTPISLCIYICVCYVCVWIIINVISNNMQQISYKYIAHIKVNYGGYYRHTSISYTIVRRWFLLYTYLMVSSSVMISKVMKHCHEGNALISRINLRNHPPNFDGSQQSAEAKGLFHCTCNSC